MLAFTSHDSATTALNRRESLLHYLGNPIEEPTLPEGADQAARIRYDRARMDYLSGGIVILTTPVVAGKKLLTRAFSENRMRNSGHSGVILSGNSTLGKTTAAKRLMKWVFDNYTDQVPEWRAFEHVPVMYVEVPPGSNAKSLLKEFAEFFGLSVTTRDTASDLRTKVVAAIRNARTQLIVVDELQNLDGRASGLGESVDLLKGLHNDVSATFLYCGIDVTNSALMSGSRGQQLSSRFTVLELKPYLFDDEWRRLIYSFEIKMALRDHPKGTLDKHAEYIYQRTGGSIGSLGRLLTGTAIELIESGAKVERLDREILAGYQLDYTAEQHYAKILRTQNKKGKSALERALQG